MTAYGPPCSSAYDVIVVGGGPAGSTLGWMLARAGARVAIVERRVFPREKVCGDYVEPGGLRMLSHMGLLERLETSGRPRITRNRAYFGPRQVYSGKIHYYGHPGASIDYGLVVPRDVLDTALLSAAREVGAVVHAPCLARRVERLADDRIAVDCVGEGGASRLTAPLVVGADGVESTVARWAGLRRTNRRHIGISQRAYVGGADIDEGEAVVWFDEDIAPGYGWAFPIGGGCANVGVGFWAENTHSFDLSLPAAFESALARLRLRHPGFAGAELVRRPLGPAPYGALSSGRAIGGTIKTYAGIDTNHFDGGLLVGDAGSFVDPITGEGITQGMESAVLASRALLGALERGRFGRSDLARYEEDFRRYFGPSMEFLGFTASLMANRHMAPFWLRLWAHGHEEAVRNPAFAGVAGAMFGGPALQPLTASAQIWTQAAERFAEAVRRAHAGDASLLSRFRDDFEAFSNGWSQSRAADDVGHSAWLGDMLQRLVSVQKTLWTRDNPRAAGVFAFVAGAPGGEPTASTPLARPDAQAALVAGVRSAVDLGLALVGNLLTPPRVAPLDSAPRRRGRIKP